MMMAEEQVNLIKSRDKAEIAVIKVVSARLKEGRELCGFTLTHSAHLFGVAVEELKSWESGIDINSIPLQAIHTAGEIYQVSIDWLFGLVDDWENSEDVRRERDFSVHLQSLFVTEQAKIATEMLKQNNQIAALTEAVTVLGPAIREIYEAILRFWQLNKGFDDMPGGAPVIGCLDRADKAAHEVSILMFRAGLLPPEMLNNYPIQEPTNQTV